MRRESKHLYFGGTTRLYGACQVSDKYAMPMECFGSHHPFYQCFWKWKQTKKHTQDRNSLFNSLFDSSKWQHPFYCKGQLFFLGSILRAFLITQASHCHLQIKQWKSFPAWWVTRGKLCRSRPNALLTSKMDRKVCTGKVTDSALTKHSYKNTITRTYLLQTRG